MGGRDTFESLSLFYDAYPNQVDWIHNKPSRLDVTHRFMDSRF